MMNETKVEVLCNQIDWVLSGCNARAQVAGGEFDGKAGTIRFDLTSALQRHELAVVMCALLISLPGCSWRVERWALVAMRPVDGRTFGEIASEDAQRRDMPFHAPEPKWGGK